VAGALGGELLRLARSKLPSKPGTALSLSFGGVLLPDKTLQEQGIPTNPHGIFTYTRTCLLKAWNMLAGSDFLDEQALEGTTKLRYEAASHTVTASKFAG
ncbi:unnamed protein product, partial [Effrenium voratum]